MSRLFATLGLVGFVGLLGLPCAHAAGPITMRYQHFLFMMDASKHPEWKAPSEEWTWSGAPVDPPAAWRVDGDTVPSLPAGVQKIVTFTWNRPAIRKTIDETVGKFLNRPAGSVVIAKDKDGKITFDGVGLTGRQVDADAATDFLIAALDRTDVTDIALPVTVTQPQVRVDDADLTAQGIKEVVTVGESDLSRSPVNRRFNIGVGLAKFNGHLIPANSNFSFDAVLGPVNGETGFRKELVIKGDRTEPDYGGGLCQVSTTAYRGVWEYGFPILVRRNHSYTVSHYAPAGTDATVYPGSADMVFTNDLSHPLLIQTYKDGDLAYFIYYGTRDNRKVDLFGPFVSNRKEPPPDKTELTMDLPPGEKKKLNERVPGLHALWFRSVTDESGKKNVEKVSSIYEARPLFYAIGVAELPPGYKQSGSGTTLFTEGAAE